MKKTVIILFLAGFFSGTVSAQESDETAKRTLEREIKTSGEYLYGEAVGNTKDEAIKAAKTALISEINREALNHPEWQFAKSIQAKDVEYGTDMIDLMRGNKFRVIAYIKKDNLTIVFHDKAPNVKLEDKKQEKAKPKQEKSESVPVVQDSVKISSPEQTETDVAQKNTDNLPKQAPATVEKKNTGTLLEQIVSASSMREIQTILTENKRSGKTVYGTLDKLVSPETAYLVVYKKTGKIVAVLDRGNGNSRKDLISGEMKGKEIYENNQVIWFQLY